MFIYITASNYLNLIINMNLSEDKKYEGDYLHNWFHGKGKYYFDNGVIYEGSFYKGEFHGEGTMYYPNGVSNYKSYII